MERKSLDLLKDEFQEWRMIGEFIKSPTVLVHMLEAERADLVMQTAVRWEMRVYDVRFFPMDGRHYLFFHPGWEGRAHRVPFADGPGVHIRMPWEDTDEPGFIPSNN